MTELLARAWIWPVALAACVALLGVAKRETSLAVLALARLGYERADTPEGRGAITRSRRAVCRRGAVVLGILAATGFACGGWPLAAALAALVLWPMYRVARLTWFDGVRAEGARFGGDAPVPAPTAGPSDGAAGRPHAALAKALASSALTIALACCPGIGLVDSLGRALAAAAGTPTTGTVVATWTTWKQGRSGYRIATDHARVAYADAAGRTHTYEDIVRADHPVRVGDAVAVRYLPWAPGRAAALSTLGLDGTGWLLASLVAGAFTGVPALVAAAGWRAVLQGRAGRPARRGAAVPG